MTGNDGKHYREQRFGMQMAIQTAMVWLLAFGVREGTAIQTNTVYDGVVTLIGVFTLFFLLYAGVHQAFGLYDLYQEEYA